MTNPSNLYAEKIFAEHPLALWSLDEQLDYLSLISEANRGLTVWESSPEATVTYSTSIPSADDLIGIPFPESSYTKIISGTIDSYLIETISIMPSSAPISLASINQNLKTVTFAFYIKAPHSYTTSVEIGLASGNSANGFSPAVITIHNKQVFSEPIPGEWGMYSATFLIPDIGTDTHILPVVSFKYINQNVATGGSGSYEYSYVINGFTAGQWNQEFNSTSLGVETVSDASSIESLGADSFLSGAQYGLGNIDAKYLIKDNILLAKNTSLPMVYGSSNLTKLIPNSEGFPSLVIPSLGMLNNSGRYNTYTFETWIRIDSRSTITRKILGPLNSDNGLYVDGPFLRLNVGGVTGSYFVGEWYRPLLIDIRVALNSVSLLINGEEVISIEISTSELILNDEDSENGYWGFYAYDDVPIIEIDCPAIYSYSVPSLVAKRRFAYGQSVESPDGVNKSFGASTAFIDYSVADYTNNYHYPDIGDWGQGVGENIVTDNRLLSSPQQSLPTFIFSNSNYDDWFYSQRLDADTQQAQLDILNSAILAEYPLAPVQDLIDPSFSFKDKPGFIRFDTLSVDSQAAKAAYVICEIDEFSYSEKNIFKIINKINGDEFRVSLLFDTITYSLKTRGIESVVDTRQGAIAGDKLFIGASFEELSNILGGEVRSFFNNYNQLIMLVAGDSSFENMFDGKIYKVGLCTQRNLSKISDYFVVQEALGIVDGGLPETTTWFATLDAGEVGDDLNGILYNHIASYTLAASYRFRIFNIDIDADSYWQDYVPLSYFAQYVKDLAGNYFYDLDFLQFNIDYPAPQTFINSSYDTSSSLVKSYVSFQLIAGGSTKQLSAFSEIIPAPSNGVVETTSWMDTVYEVVDGMIIYPPKDVDLNTLSIVSHIEMQVVESTKNSIAIKKLQYASQAFNAESANPIGTKFNVNVYPYQKYSAYFDYKSRNPYKIYKGSTPHLYLTKKTGIQKVGDYDPLINRGFLININNKKADEYRVIAAQMFTYYENSKFPAEDVKLFEIQSAYEYIKVYMSPIDSTRRRARLYAFDAMTGTTRDGVAFYINGKICLDPVITVNEWAALGIRFAEPIIFDNNTGAIRFTGPLLVNSISYYESSSLQEVERQSFRLWDSVASNSKDWEYWKNLVSQFGESYVWKDVLVVSSTKYSGVDPSNIYKAYTGTNKIIGNDNATFYIGGSAYKITNGLTWSSNIVKPL